MTELDPHPGDDEVPSADWIDGYATGRADEGKIEGKITTALTEQLAEAVEALRWALGFIEYQGEPSPADDPREGEADAAAYAHALKLIGGQ